LHLRDECAMEAVCGLAWTKPVCPRAVCWACRAWSAGMGVRCAWMGKEVLYQGLGRSKRVA
jgi:hypothetical protein